MENYIDQIPVTLILLYLFIGGLLHFVFKIINTYIIPLQTDRKSLQNKFWQRIQIIIWMGFSLLFFSSIFMANKYLTLSLTAIALSLGWSYWVNLFSGILFKFSGQLNKGDYIETASISGKILQINLSHTKLLNNQKETIIIPNHNLRKHAIKQLHKKQGLKIYNFYTKDDFSKSHDTVLESVLNCPYIAVNQEIKIQSMEKGRFRVKASLIDPFFKDKVVRYFENI